MHNTEDFGTRNGCTLEQKENQICTNLLHKPMQNEHALKRYHSNSIIFVVAVYIQNFSLEHSKHDKLTTPDCSRAEQFNVGWHARHKNKKEKKKNGIVIRRCS